VKFRFIVIIWIILLGVCLIPVFMKTEVKTRDMVYYNAQVRNVEEGGEAPADAVVINVTDRDYQARLNTYLKNEALVMDITKDGALTGKIIWDDSAEYKASQEQNMLIRNIVIWAAVAVCGTALILFIYLRYIRPFGKLKKFAGEIAKGNLDFPLEIGRSDFFGGFTESFDIMRTELKDARAKEAALQKAKQEMLAELSHDIRTPLSTISATCEVLEVKNPTPDVTAKTGVIKSKVATIDSLIANMMSASLAEAEELKVKPREESSALIANMVNNLRDVGEVNVSGELPECLLYFDALRLEQVIDNVVGNSLKYAGTAIGIEYIRQDSGVVIKISDKGPGVKEDELTLITQKFYRGSESDGLAGSGLGLYLADYFMKKMEGDIAFHNAPEGGFVAEIFVRKV
jgi:signal transduction histidine kinase